MARRSVPKVRPAPRKCCPAPSARRPALKVLNPSPEARRPESYFLFRQNHGEITKQKLLEIVKLLLQFFNFDEI